MPIGVSFTVEDGKGAKSTTIIHIPSATALVDAQEFAVAVAQMLADLMGGGLVSVGVCYDIDISGLTDNGIAQNSDVEDGARFGWNVAGGFKASNRLGTFLETLYLPGTKQVDLTDPDVIAFVDVMVDGFVPISTLTVLPMDYRDADIEALDTALENFTKSRILRQ